MLTLLFVLIKVPLQIVCSLGLALLAHQKLRMIGFVRSAMFMPVVTSMVIVSIVWAMIYHPNNGLLNGLLALLGLPPQGFLNDSRQALPAVLFTSLWKDVAYTMIIFLAGLQGIPSTFYDAAQVDGASKFKLFWYITLPLLRSTMLFVTVITTINTFQIYTPVYVMTKGGPLQATNVVVYFIYERAFLFNEMGYASALSVTVLLMILAVSLVEMRLMRGHVEY
ncbi:MAG: sugar ABC transporter permease [Bacillota bacterium]